MADGVELATAYVSLVVAGDKVAPGVRKALGAAEPEATRAGTRSGKAYSKSLTSSVGGSAKSLAKGLAGTFAAIGIVDFFKDSNAEAREAQKVSAQTNAVLKSTAGAANIGAAGVGNLANAISKKVGIDDEAIQAGENMLLTFRNVRNETGKGNKIFNQATKAATDMGVAMGMDTTKAALQLGKALNDPTKGLSKLQRQGVTFTDQQTKQVKALQASGDILGAQKIILREVTKEFGGSAAAQATAGDKANVAFKNLEETVGTALLPVLDKAANFFTTKGAPAITKFVGEMQSGTGAGGQLVDVFHETVDVGARVLGFFNSLPGPVKKFGAEGLIAYAAVSKLTGVLGVSKFSGFISQLANSETRLDAVASASNRLGAGVRKAAGVGGMIALTAGAQTSNKEVGTLLTTLGGAATGFSVGGPVGAAIGGLGGLFVGLATHTRGAGDAAKYALGDFGALKSTLDGVTGATTAATRAFVLDGLTKSKALKTTRELGIADREVVNAIVNGGAARTKVAGQIGQQVTATQKLIKANELSARGARGGAAAEAAAKGKELEARLKALKALKAELGASDAAVAAKRREIAANRTFSKAINTLTSKPAIVDIKANGLEPTRQAIVNLTAKYHLVPKDVATLIKENGGTPTKKKIDAIIAAAKALGNQHPIVPIGAKDHASGTIAAVRAHLVALNGQHADVIIRTRNIHGGTAPGGADGMTVPRYGVGGTVAGRLRPYGDKVLAHLAPGEEVISNRYGQADRNRALLKAINSNRYSGGGTVASRASSVAVGSDGSLVVHLYDSNDVLLGTMQGVADDRYEANQALPR